MSMLQIASAGALLFDQSSRRSTFEILIKILILFKYGTMFVKILEKNKNISPPNFSTKSNEELLQHVQEQQKYQKELEFKNEELRINEVQFRKLFTDSPVGLGLVDLNGNILIYNDAILKPGNYDRNDFKIKNVSELYFDTKQRDEVLALLNKQGFVNDFDVLLKRKDGTHYNASLSLSKTIFKGQPCIQTVVEDISFRVQVEKTLREGKNKFDNIVSTVPGVICSFRQYPDGRSDFPYASPTIEEVYGLKWEDIKDDASIVHTLIHPDDLELVQDTITESAKNLTQWHIEYRFKHSIKGEIWIESNFIPMRDIEGSTIWQGILTDITHRKKYEENLKFSENQFRDLFENSNDLICTHDLEGNLILLNKTAELYTGYSLDELKKMNLQDLLISTYKNLFKNYIATIQSEGSASGIMLIQTKTGEIRYWLYNNSLRTEGVEFPIVRGIAKDITEQKIAEKELYKKQKELQDFFDEDISAVYLANVEGNLEECNNTFLDLFGFKTKEEALSYPLSKLYIDSSARKLFIDKIKANKKIELFESEYITLNGNNLCTIENVSGIFNDKNELIKIKGYIVDITDRVKALGEIRKLSRAIEQSPVSIVITNPDGDIEYINEKFCEVTGYSKKEIIGKNPRILKSGNHNKEFYEELWDTILSGKVWNGEILNKKKNKELYWESASISSLFNKSGDITSFIAVKEDITERKKAEKEILLLANSLKSVNECLSITDMNGKIIFVNKSFIETYGYSEKELIGKHISVFWSDKNKPEKVLEILSSTIKRRWYGELINIRKDGTEFPITLSTAPIIDKDNNTIALIGVVNDITELKRRQKELVEAKEKAEESSKIKSHFLALMSHELRTPLAGILGFSEILSDEVKDTELKEFSQSIFKAGTRLKNTLNAILDISKISIENKQIDFIKIDITERVRLIANSFKDEANLKRLELHYLKQNAPLFGKIDKTMFDIVLNNIISNAIKYTNEGSVKVKTSLKNENKIKWIAIEVKDTGIGIRKDKIDIIFDEFRQVDEGMARNFEGVGLGLTIAKKYVEILNGQITVASQPGKGSTFTVKIPLDSSEETTSVNDEEKPKNKSKNSIGNIDSTKDESEILVVEDEEINAIAIKRFIDKTCTVDIAHTPTEALAMCKLKKYSLVLMDINLKSSIDGIHLKERIIKEYKNYIDVPFIAQTAYTLSSDKNKIMDSGFEDYLAKPYSRDELLSVVNKSLSLLKN